MTGVLIKKERLGHRDTPTGRTSCERDGRDQGDTSTSQRTAKIASEPPECTRRHGTVSLPQPSEGTIPADTLISDF